MLRYFHLFIYDIKFRNTPCDFYVFHVLKKVVASKWLNGTTKVVGDIKCYHAKQERSFTH